MAKLFQPITLRGTDFKRVRETPMGQYAAINGLPNTSYLVHLGQFAVGRAGLILTEATAVAPSGRISPVDAGLRSEAHEDTCRRRVNAEHLTPVENFAVPRNRSS